MTRAVGHGTYEHDCDVGQVTWLSPSSWDFDMYNCQHLLPAQRVHINVKPRETTDDTDVWIRNGARCFSFGD